MALQYTGKEVAFGVVAGTTNDILQGIHDTLKAAGWTTSYGWKAKFEVFNYTYPLSGNEFIFSKRGPEGLTGWLPNSPTQITLHYGFGLGWSITEENETLEWMGYNDSVAGEDVTLSNLNLLNSNIFKTGIFVGKGVTGPQAWFNAVVNAEAVKYGVDANRAATDVPDASWGISSQPHGGGWTMTSPKNHRGACLDVRVWNPDGASIELIFGDTYQGGEWVKKAPPIRLNQNRTYLIIATSAWLTVISPDSTASGDSFYAGMVYADRPHMGLNEVDKYVLLHGSWRSGLTFENYFVGAARNDYNPGPAAGYGYTTAAMEGKPRMVFPNLPGTNLVNSAGCALQCEPLIAFALEADGSGPARIAGQLYDALIMTGNFRIDSSCEVDGRRFRCVSTQGPNGSYGAGASLWLMEQYLGGFNISEEGPLTDGYKVLG